MKNIIIILLSNFILFSCTASAPQKNISYKTVENYFVKNTYNNKNFTEELITSQEVFDSIFGSAATMGKAGKPTPIDFSKENVLVLIHPKTGFEVEIVPVSLQGKDKSIVYSYKVTTKPQRGFMTIPNSIIIIQKNISEKIIFNKMKE